MTTPTEQTPYRTLRIAEIREAVRDFKIFTFAEGHGIAYQAGQYLTLVQQQPGGEIRRSYSITSAPHLAEPLSIGVKRVPNGAFSRRLLDHARVGDSLHTIGAGGLFVLPENIAEVKQLVFFAAGSGITPVFSLLKTALHRHPHLQVALVYSNASPEKAIFKDAIQELHRQFEARFRLELLFSNSPNLYRARLHRDLILEYLRTLVPPGAGHTLFYICGPESYMRLCTYTLQGAGISGNNIKREHFILHTAPPKRALPPDGATHRALIKMGGAQQEITVHYPDSTLTAAKKEGMRLPYSCEVGRCGNCVARCTSGSVWHSYNEVLTEKELGQGLVLTCVAHPVGGNVTLEIG